MSQGEFDIIKRYFQRANHANDGVAVGIGDDCAILDIPEGYQLAVTTDSLVSGVHFFEDVDERQHLLGFVINEVAGEADNVGVLAIDQLNGVVERARAGPATGVHVADLDDFKSVQARG